MYFEQIANGSCFPTRRLRGNGWALVVDPAVELVERYIGIAHQHGLQIGKVLVTHTPADHSSRPRALAQRTGATIILHSASPAPFIDLRVNDGDAILLGKLLLRVRHTPGHTADAISLILEDRILTGDALLIGGAGRPICRAVIRRNSMTVCSAVCQAGSRARDLSRA